MAKFGKGKCNQCFKSNVLINDVGLCFKCELTNFRLEIQQAIKENGLKAVQIEWENIFKPQVEELLRSAEQHQAGLGLTEEEKKEAKRMAQEFFETIEKDLYPDRYKGGSGLVWILVIVVIVAVGVVGFIWYRNERSKH